MSAFQPGDVIGGRYRLDRVIGAGAMGVVWAAKNEATDRDFALKLMTPDAARDPQRLSRFFKEAKLAGRLRHRCIVEVYDLGRIESGPQVGAPYLVMELLDGEPLDALLRRMGKLPSGTALRILADVARGLEIAHRQGIVHRDLKPANVFLHRALDGRTTPKILDFGISKLISGGHFDAQETTIGTILGSPAYMSPEQTAGEDLDPRADVWSLGVLLYKALSGELPFVAGNFTTLMLAINTSDPRPLGDRVPELPPAVCALVHRCLARRRGERFPNAGAFAGAIDEVLATHDLPVLELSQVVGQAPPPSASSIRTIQLGMSTTSPTRELVDTRATESTFDALPDAEPQIVDAPLVAPAPRTGRRRALGVAAIAAAALVGLFALLRTPASPQVSVAATAAKPAVAAAPTPTPSASVSQTPLIEKLEIAPKPAEKPVEKAKPAPAKPKTKPAATTAPHEGLVHPGF